MEKNNPQNTDQFEALFQFSREGIIVADSKGIIIMANPAAEKLFGYSAGSLCNEKIEVLIPQKFQSNHAAHRQQFNEKPTPRTMGSGRDLFGLRKDGSEFPIEISLSPFGNDAGIFVIAFLVDITVRKKQESDIKKQKNELELLTLELEKRVKKRTMILEEALQQLEQSREDLKKSLDKEIELNEMKSRFVAMASHEFRTPLATMLSSLSLLNKYCENQDRDKQLKHMNRIKDSIHHLTDLLNDVLSISKLEEGKASVEFENFNIADFTAETIHELQAVADNGQQIIYNHEGTTQVFLDKKSLRIIYFNLISNAIKFSPANSIIDVYTHVKEDGIAIGVKDNGIGISDEDKEHLFQRFFRGRNVTNIQGTGLGLHIVARYIDILKGTISVESTINKGTSFIIALPNQKHYD